MGMCGFSVPRSGQRTRPAVPAVAPGRPRRGAALGTWLLVLALALALAGCASLAAAFRAGSALQGAGYQNVDVKVWTGSGLPADGLVTVTYDRGPSGNDQQDAQRAEKIVWDTFSSRFGALHVVKASGGCTGPVCVTHSTETARATYAQLAARLGPRPHDLEKAGAAVPGWAIALGAFAGLGGLIALAVIVLVLILRRRKRKSQPPGPPPWPPGPPAGWSSGSP